MKRIFALVISISLWNCVVLATDVKVEAFMTTTLDGEPVTSFAADTRVLHAMFKTKGAKNGDKIRVVWIADDVGEAAPKRYKIHEAAVTAEGDTDDGEFTLEKSGDWPRGDYHIEIYVNDELAAQVKFTIKPPKWGKQAEGKEEEGSSKQ